VRDGVGQEQGHLTGVCVRVGAVTAVRIAAHFLLSQAATNGSTSPGDYTELAADQHMEDSPAKPKELFFAASNDCVTMDKLWAVCRSQMDADHETSGHLDWRKSLVSFAEHEPEPSQAYLLDSINEGQANGQIDPQEGDESVLCRWLVYMHMPGVYADQYCLVMLARFMQTQVRVYSFNPVTGSPRNSPVDKALRETTALCLLLNRKHYFLLISDVQWLNIPALQRPVPACNFETPDGELFRMFGVSPDGNCFFRAIDKWSSIFGIGINTRGIGINTRKQLHFNEGDPINSSIKAPDEVELFVTSTSSILVIDAPQHTLTPGDSVHDPDGVDGSHTFLVGHALVRGWKRYVLLWSYNLKLVEAEKFAETALQNNRQGGKGDLNHVDLTKTRDEAWKQDAFAFAVAKFVETSKPPRIVVADVEGKPVCASDKAAKFVETSKTPRDDEERPSDKSAISGKINALEAKLDQANAKIKSLETQAKKSLADLDVLATALSSSQLQHEDAMADLLQTKTTPLRTSYRQAALFENAAKDAAKDERDSTRKETEKLNTQFTALQRPSLSARSRRRRQHMSRLSQQPPL
jgi:hypothetical protein